jgi:hypothetical protein
LFNWVVAKGYEDGGILFKGLKLSLDGGLAHSGKRARDNGRFGVQMSRH